MAESSVTGHSEEQPLFLKKVDPEVVESLVDAVQVDVIVSIDFSEGTLEEAQQDVVASLDPSLFSAKRMYENIPAVSGVVLDVEALHLLNAHPLVAAVSLDAAIGGG
jgi:hypothetical protein